MSLRDLNEKVRWDYSYLGKWERGERRPTKEQVDDLDHALNANGTLQRVFELVQHLKSQGGSPDQVVASVANHDLSVANDVATLANGEASPPGWTQDDMLAVPAWRPDGTELGMAMINRRLLLGGLGAATAGAMSGFSSTAKASVNIPDDMSPAEHFHNVKCRLMDRDNLRGPAAAISDAQEHLTAMADLVNRLSGEERGKLLEVRTQMADLAGWLYQDAGFTDGASYWLSQSIEWSHLVDPQVTAFMLARKSQMLAELGDPHGALDSALAAVKLARSGSRISVVAHTFAGHAHAILGEAGHSNAAYETAAATIEHMDESGPGEAYALFMEPAYLRAYQAHSLAALREYSRSAEHFGTALEQLKPGMHRDRGVYTAWMAQSLTNAGDHSRAVQRGMEALAIASGTGSARIRTELHRLAEQLPNSSESAQFRDALEDLKERN